MAGGIWSSQNKIQPWDSGLSAVCLAMRTHREKELLFTQNAGNDQER